VTPSPPRSASLWRDPDFLRLWSAGTISVFGTLITRTALPLAAILVLGAGALEVSFLRGLEIAAGLVFGLVAGVWVDRLRRRPILIAADLGRAVLLGSVPVAALAGALTLPHLLLVAFLASILTIFFDVADRAYLPTLVPAERLVTANSSLTATMSVAEFAGFGISGFLVQVLTAPIAIAIDAVTYVISALLIREIRAPEPPPPPVHEREPVLAEIREGLRVIGGAPILRAYAIGSALAHLLWGVFGSVWILYATRELGLTPAMIGVVAGIGGIGSLAGAVIIVPLARRLGVGPTLLVVLVGFVIGNAFIPLAPTGAPLLAAGFLIGQQLLGDSCATGFDVLGRSVVQAKVGDAQLGRAAATIRSGELLLMLGGTFIGGVVGELVSLRAALWIGIGFAALAFVTIWRSPIRGLREMPVRQETPAEALEGMPVTE
jgi:MFS family permease